MRAFRASFKPVSLTLVVTVPPNHCLCTALSNKEGVSYTPGLRRFYCWILLRRSCSTGGCVLVYVRNLAVLVIHGACIHSRVREKHGAVTF